MQFRINCPISPLINIHLCIHPSDPISIWYPIEAIHPTHTCFVVARIPFTELFIVLTCDNYCINTSAPHAHKQAPLIYSIPLQNIANSYYYFHFTPFREIASLCYWETQQWFEKYVWWSYTRPLTLLSDFVRSVLWLCMCLSVIWCMFWV